MTLSLLKSTIAMYWSGCLNPHCKKTRRTWQDRGISFAFAFIGRGILSTTLLVLKVTFVPQTLAKAGEKVKVESARIAEIMNIFFMAF